MVFTKPGKEDVVRIPTLDQLSASIEELENLLISGPQEFALVITLSKSEASDDS